MPETKPITIIGGGLAGLTLGIGLRQRSVPVTLWEAGSYPRHRVCGEFISGRGQAVVERLGLRTTVVRAGMIPAKTTAFFSRQSGSPVLPLAEPAWSVSRFDLDAALAEQFKNLGGNLRSRERWPAGECGDGIIRASGRRLQSHVSGWRWFGLKVHATNVKLTADLEMHLSPGGYVGMSYLQNGSVNICGLFRRRVMHNGRDGHDDNPARWQEILRGAPGTIRHERLAAAQFDEASFCSVAGLSLHPRRASESAECCIGDAVTMIPPVTGNGMSMAFESAGHAIEPLANYSAGRITWAEARQNVSEKCDAAFARRLAWAGGLQKILFQGWLQAPLVRLAPRLPALWKLLVDKTR